jgi:hypothetical protein
MNKTFKKSKTVLYKIFPVAFMLLAVFTIYFYSNPKVSDFYDYTFRVAGSLLNSSVGLNEEPPSWLNEFVPYGGKWYSVFPLGSVLTMIPFAYAQSLGILKDMPSAFIAALAASLSCLFMYLISLHYAITKTKRYLLIAAMLFGTWLWTNLTMAGAWQLALGWALAGQLGAVYFAVYNRNAFWAGVFFALAFGNRTEILLAAPVLMYLLLRPDLAKLQSYLRPSKHIIIQVAKFSLVPAILGILTLLYNNIRFDSYFDFGYARIPGVLDEPWYRDGIFSYKYIPRQAEEMLLKLWRAIPNFPTLVPDPFSNSILISSPFLALVARFGSRDKILKYLSLAMIIILTVFLWMHGNSGGWQFGYRYAIILLPWIFVVLLENGGKKLTLLESMLFVYSIAVTAYATYLFHWTEVIQI